MLMNQAGNDENEDEQPKQKYEPLSSDPDFVHDPTPQSSPRPGNPSIVFEVSEPDEAEDEGAQEYVEDFSQVDDATQTTGYFDSQMNTSLAINTQDADRSLLVIPKADRVSTISTNKKRVSIAITKPGETSDAAHVSELSNEQSMMPSQTPGMRRSSRMNSMPTTMNHGSTANTKTNTRGNMKTILERTISRLIIQKTQAADIEASQFTQDPNILTAHVESPKAVAHESPIGTPDKASVLRASTMSKRSFDDVGEDEENALQKASPCMMPYYRPRSTDYDHAEHPLDFWTVTSKKLDSPILSPLLSSCASHYDAPDTNLLPLLHSYYLRIFLPSICFLFALHFPRIHCVS
ncbi:hypothetical protein DL93DRAFT_2184955 [Clavulina sp. PMI_390]|nr:hypothetical protein DL93DRAFT_2184955 [Clavulina sp. PMI_390]